METAEIVQTSKSPSKRRKAIIAILLGMVLVAAAIAAVWFTGEHQAAIPATVAQPVSATAAPLYHKKQLVFKRVVAEPDLQDIRVSSNSAGYQALHSIPPTLVAPQPLVRSPQFLDSYTFNNYRALSTLGSQKYYSNTNVQTLLNNLSNQQFLSNLQFQMANNLSYQQYVADLNFKNLQNNLQTQQYLANMNFQQAQANLNFQQYLNNLNMQQFQNNLNYQTYLNNWNTYSNSTAFNTPSFTPPIQFTVPQVNFYAPSVQFTVPQVNFNTPPVYNPPPMPHFP